MKKALYAMCISILFIPSLVSATTTPPTLSVEQVASIMAQIAALQAQLQLQMAAEPSTGTDTPAILELKFDRILKRGTIGDDVKQLQAVLAAHPDIYPEGLITGYFGMLTEKAVKNLQKSNGIVTSGSPETTGFGQVGPKTVAKLNEVVVSGGGGYSGGVPSGNYGENNPTANNTGTNSTGTSTGEMQVTLCHIPSGSTSTKQTLTVGSSAVAAHLAHGDYLGACLSGTGTSTPPTGTTTPPATGGGGSGGGGGSNSGSTPDTTPPSVSISSPSNGSTASGTTIISAVASDNIGVVGVQFLLDGANFGSEDTASPFSISWNTGSSTNAAHTLLAVARDAAGNRATSSSVGVTVSNVPGTDTSAPTVSISAPSDGGTVSGTVSVTAAATDNFSVTGVQFLLDGVNLGGEVTSSKFTLSWDTTGVVNGAHSLTARARDAAGNSATSSINVTVSNATPPAGWTNNGMGSNGEYQSIAGNGNGYGAVYGWGNQLHFVKLGTSGNKISDVTFYTVPNYTFWTNIVWDGTKYGVVWPQANSQSIRFATLDTNGTVLTNIEIAAPSDDPMTERPALFWTGSEYVISWNRYQGNIYLTKVASDGQAINVNKAGVITTGTAKAANGPIVSISWNSSIFGIVWQDIRNTGNTNQPELYFNTLDALGNKLGVDTKISGSTVYSPSIVADGANFDIVWSKGGNIYFTQVDGTGSTLVAAKNLNTKGDDEVHPIAIKNSGGSAIFWTSNAEQSIYFKTIDASGNIITDNSKVNTAGGSNDNAFPTMSGSQYGVVWENVTSNQSQIYVATE